VCVCVCVSLCPAVSRNLHIHIRTVNSTKLGCFAKIMTAYQNDKFTSASAECPFPKTLTFLDGLMKPDVKLRSSRRPLLGPPIRRISFKLLYAPFWTAHCNIVLQSRIRLFSLLNLNGYYIYIHTHTHTHTHECIPSGLKVKSALCPQSVFICYM
jgi:hypothetical protein